MATNMEQLITQTLNRVSEKGEVTSADLFVLRYCQQAEARRNKTPAYKQILNGVGDVVSGHHFFDMAQHKIHQHAFDTAKHLADVGDDDVFNGRVF